MISPPELRAARAVIAKANKERRKARPRPPKIKADRGRVRDNAHLAFIRRLPCVATYVETGRVVFGFDAAHVRFADSHAGKAFTGTQRKPDDCWTVPLTREAHERQHGGSERAFWVGLGVDVLDLCRRLYAASGDDAAGLQIITSLRKS